ncbi:MAG: bifunctional folylpolyglutamate synthase/dihydrofolate synthase [Syntrophobacterales bacterium]|jgi:dihydrofolate synthase/folylpolyglutamate synthase|nr:bifunctional folylpolyglutamate synthase/dihydrofolate synthase [Syntrophobacterales bacterium]
MKGYEETLRYLAGLEKFGAVFGLENIEWILNLLNNPHRRIKTVHVAGTNGKGSVASMLSRMLLEGGYKVGKYTSPHLVSFTERISVNEVEIREEEVADIANWLRNKVRETDEEKFFTYFDFTTALAFEFFFERQTDICVIETGLGGRLDSTNAVLPLVSIITNVDYDHMDCLGNEIFDIAREKAGIIKSGVPVVTGAYGLVLRVIEEEARNKGSAVFALGKDFRCSKESDQCMTYESLNKRFKNIFVNLKGDHQLRNGALALAATECLTLSGFCLNEKDVRAGLSNVEWPGRLEVVKSRPTVLFDGAHNVHGARALKDYLRSHYSGKKKILVFGVMRDKAYEEILNEILPLFDIVILTRPHVERALSPFCLQDYVKGARIIESVKDALAEAQSAAGDEDLIVVTGSMYTIGEARSIIGGSI